MQSISIKSINPDARTQARASLNSAVVNDYAELMRAGHDFPPISIIAAGEELFIADGHHRFHAAMQAGRTEIAVAVKTGTLRDAIFAGFSANSTHGLPRSGLDKRKAITAMLADPEWRKMSDREIATVASVSAGLVAKVRSELGCDREDIVYQHSGTVRTMKRQQRDKVAEIELHKNAVGVGPKFDERHIAEETMIAAIELLRTENEQLLDQLAVAHMEGNELDKAMATRLLEGLRSDVRLLEIEAKAVTDSRNQFQSENAQMMRQLNWQTKILKKCTCQVR